MKPVWLSSWLQLYVQDYSSLSEEEMPSSPQTAARILVSCQLLTSLSPNFCKRTGNLQTARQLKDAIGEEVIKQNIISHSTSVSDLLELAIMLKEGG